MYYFISRKKVCKPLYVIFSLWWGLLALPTLAQLPEGLTRKDLRKDVLLKTSEGKMIIRLSDSTPLHRNNFLLLAKQHYYEGMLFHRVISRFMIQTGDPKSKNALPGQALGDSGASYKIPAEIRKNFFHHKGVVAAARMGDDVNPERMSSGSHFYIVQGRVHTDESLDSVERYRLQGRKIPVERREVYKTMGGSPHLDQSYTIFGYVAKGIEVIERIASTPTSKSVDKDRPLKDIRILKTRLIRRRNYSDEALRNL